MERLFSEPSSAAALQGQGCTESLPNRSDGRKGKQRAGRGLCVTEPKPLRSQAITSQDPFQAAVKLCLRASFFFYLHFFAERTNLVPRSSDGWKSQNFQPKFIRDPFIPICSCANTGLQFKQLSSLPSVNPPAPCFHRQQSHLSKPNKGCICCTSLQLILF